METSVKVSQSLAWIVMGTRKKQTNKQRKKETGVNNSRNDLID